MNEAVREVLGLRLPELNFGSFAQQPEYIDVNRFLVQKLCELLPNPFIHIDVATGTGLIPRLIIEQCQRLGRIGRIIGIDPNPVSLDIARRSISSDEYRVEFIEGYGQETDRLLADRIPPEGADSVSIHDAIHEIPTEEEKRQTIAAMAQVLKPSGIFTYNSAFTTVAMGRAAMDWGRWKAAAIGILLGKRDKEVEPIRIHTPEEYRQMICDAGLVVIHEANDRVVDLSRVALEAISRYPAFVEGVFRDMLDNQHFSLEEKSEALVAALDKLGVISIPRTWHEIMAQKKTVTSS